MSEFHCDCPEPETLPGDRFPFITVDGLHALTDTEHWPGERPVMIRIGNGKPRLAYVASQIETAQLHGREQRVLLLADTDPALVSGDLPYEPPRTVGELIAALQELPPDRPVATPAPHGGNGHIQISTATLQARQGQPRGEGIFARAGALSAGDVPVGDEFEAVVLSWDDDQAPRREEQ
ncbi:hypothetical protein [Mycobacterium sp. SMC-19]|uniref:hypothetical protein n=1 Tax=Mycobacterium sp. SMC-19 TaxID=3381630 RepID=UPI003876F187